MISLLQHTTSMLLFLLLTPLLQEKNFDIVELIKNEAVVVRTFAAAAKPPFHQGITAKKTSYQQMPLLPGAAYFHYFVTFQGRV